MARPEPSSAGWEIWYSDTFDPDVPASVDAKGSGLARGLAELWARHLFETVQPNGSDGFSRFHLTWHGGRVHIAGSREGAKRLRGWLFGAKRESLHGYARAAEPKLLATLAATHARRIEHPGASGEMLALAEIAADAEEFSARLAS